MGYVKEEVEWAQYHENIVGRSYDKKWTETTVNIMMEKTKVSVQLLLSQRIIRHRLDSNEVIKLVFSSTPTNFPVMNYLNRNEPRCRFVCSHLQLHSIECTHVAFQQVKKACS